MANIEIISKNYPAFQMPFPTLERTGKQDEIHRGLQFRERDLRRRIFFHFNSVLGEGTVNGFRDMRGAILGQEGKAPLGQMEKDQIIGSYLGELLYDPEEGRDAIGRAMRVTDSAIAYFNDNSSGIFADLDAQQIASRNEIAHTNDIFDLLVMATDPTNDDRMRFEARRKLVLMDAELRLTREANTAHGKMALMADSLQKHFWIGKRGFTVPMNITTLHNPDDYSVHSWNETDSVVDNKPEGDSELLRRDHHLQMRVWRDKRGRDHRVLFNDRTKNPANRLLKAVREDTVMPRDIQDELGVKFVFESDAELDAFYFELQDRFSKDSSIAITDVIDARHAEFNGHFKGSSKQLSVLKCHLHMDGTEFEFQFFTMEGYMNSEYEDGTAVSEYQIKRLFDDGVVSMLFPAEVYQYDPEILEQWKNALIANSRQFIRSSGSHA